jgi:DNA-binding MarR family transcriptional regulator
VRREECDDDLRGKWVVITHAGRRAVLSAMRDHTKALREYFFDLLEEGDRETLTAIMQRVLEKLTPHEAQDRNLL